MQSSHCTKDLVNQDKASTQKFSTPERSALNDESSAMQTRLNMDTEMASRISNWEDPCYWRHQIVAWLSWKKTNISRMAGHLEKEQKDQQFLGIDMQVTTDPAPASLVSPRVPAHCRMWLNCLNREEGRRQSSWYQSGQKFWLKTSLQQRTMVRTIANAPSPTTRNACRQPLQNLQGHDTTKIMQEEGHFKK